MKYLRAAEIRQNAVLWGECRLCHDMVKLNSRLDIGGHLMPDGQYCRGGGRPPRERTVVNQLPVGR